MKYRVMIPISLFIIFSIMSLCLLVSGVYVLSIISVLCCGLCVYLAVLEKQMSDKDNDEVKQK